MTYFFKRKFSLPEGELGTIFFTTNIISAASMLVASSLAKRIGNVKVSYPYHSLRRSIANCYRPWSSLTFPQPSA
jgi:hypothetical protein